MGNEHLISNRPTGNLALDTRELAVIDVGKGLGVDVYRVSMTVTTKNITGASDTSPYLIGSPVR